MKALYAVGRRVAAALATLVSLSMVLFAGSEVLPGDAASASLGTTTNPEDIAAFRAEFGLDSPLPERYWHWLTGVFHGDLGISLMSRKPVTDLVAQPLAYTALLVVIAGLVTVVLSILLGVLSGLRPGSRLDRVLSGTAMVAVSIPQFVAAGLLVILFAVVLDLLPAVSLVPLGGTPLDKPEILVLPVLSMSLFAVAWASRMVRAMVIDAASAPNVEAARLAGLSERAIVWRHVLPATVPPAAQLFAWLFSALFGGTAVVEQVFNYPGLSMVLVSAVRHHDSAVLEGIGLLLALILILALIIADMVGVLANPRLRTGSAR